MTEPAVDLRCGRDGMADVVADILGNKGVSVTPCARHVLLVDEPLGWAYRQPCDQRRLVVIATTCTSPLYLADLLDTGALGVISLLPTATFFAQLETLLGGRALPPLPKTPLTPAERLTARLVAQGMSNKAVAKARGVSEKVVKNSLNNVFRKLSLDSRAELTHYYHSNWHLLPEHLVPEHVK